VINGNAAVESKTNIEKASGNEPDAGGWSVVVNENESDVPIGLNITCNSLKNDPPASEKSHGPDPLTLPKRAVESGVPSDVIAPSVTVLSGGPPSMKSKTSIAGTPLRNVLSIVTSIVAACAREHDAIRNATIAALPVSLEYPRTITISPKHDQ
jgi:hypothetical protein